MLPVRFEVKLFFALSIAFILFTCIGTLAHEMGHIAIARMLGYETYLGHGYMNYNRTASTSRTEKLLIDMGGPMQTMLTGTAGLLLLVLQRKRFNGRQRLLWTQWLLIFITLFWLRQSANMIMGIRSLGRLGRDDESQIAYLLHWPLPSIGLVTGGIGLLVLAVVTFRFIPATQRLTFMLAGLAGGIAGFWLWLIRFGPVLMP